jgi:hypothetical protein
VVVAAAGHLLPLLLAGVAVAVVVYKLQLHFRLHQAHLIQLLLVVAVRVQ